MHSASNTMDEDETRNILTWNRILLDCLDIFGEKYYQEAVEYLQDIAEEDFVIKYQSGECNIILEEVLQAKHIADELYKNIEDENLHCKKLVKRLLEILEKIDRFRIKNSKHKRLEMKQTEYRSTVIDTLETKHKAILNDKAESDGKSEQYKKLKKLEEKTSQELEELQEKAQTPETEEIAVMINKLNKEVETLKDKLKQTKAEASQLKKYTGEKANEKEELNINIKFIELDRRLEREEVQLITKTRKRSKEDLTRNVQTIEFDRRRTEKEVQNYEVGNVRRKANTSMHIERGNIRNT